MAQKHHLLGLQKFLEGESSEDIEFFKHAISWFQNNEDFIPEYIVHLRPTTPFRDPKVIDSAIKEFIDSDYTALRSCHKMSESAYKTFEVEKVYSKEYVMEVMILKVRMLQDKHFQ